MRRGPYQWAGRVALLTGASSGIGLAMARALVERGVRVAMVARSLERLEEAARPFGVEAVATFSLDLRDRNGLSKLPERVAKRFGRLDILVHSAGVNHRGEVFDRSAEELAEVLDTNLVAPILLTRAAMPHLSLDAAIVNIASLAGKVPFGGEATYCASKAGLRAFARALGEELSKEGMTVSTVCPGPVDTGFLGDLEDVPPIVFSQPMSSAEQIALAAIASIESGREEVDVPNMSGKLATLGYLAPAIFAALRPILEVRGARNKSRFAKRAQG
jgi:short-subunit dehydrogenase